MAFRTWALVCFALALVPTAGCSLPREVLGPSTGFDAGGPIDTGVGGRDVGPRPDAGIDAGSDASRDAGPPPPDGAMTCATSCDDGNGCTTDACDSTTGNCTHVPNAAGCDDGVLCNGGDTCAAGSCSLHDGVDPCPGASHCDVPTDMCMGCATTSDCPSPMPDAWTTCDFGSDLCATTGGTQSRTVTSYTCHSGTCQPSTSTEMQACTRPTTDGLMCAAGTFGDWSACDFGTDPCTQAGTQTRIATTSHCAGGACVATDTPESQACMRTTNGMSCGDVVISAWSPCMVGATCATMGTQTRTTTTPTCASGACVNNVVPESQMCLSADVTGAICGATTCSPWGACTQTMPGTCDRTGRQTRTCSTPTCSASGSTTAGCTGTSTTMEMQACSASVSGVSCTTTSCGACREAGRLDCRRGHTGSQRCTTTNGSCMDYGFGPFCGGLPSSSTNQACTCP